MQVRPVEGDTADVRETVLVNPWIDVTVMVDIAETPASAVTVSELEETVKSCTVTVIPVE